MPVGDGWSRDHVQIHIMWGILNHENTIKLNTAEHARTSAKADELESRTALRKDTRIPPVTVYESQNENYAHWSPCDLHISLVVHRTLTVIPCKRKWNVIITGLPYIPETDDETGWSWPTVATIGGYRRIGKHLLMDR